MPVIIIHLNVRLVLILVWLHEVWLQQQHTAQVCRGDLPVCLSNVCGPGLHRKLWSGFLQVKRHSLSLPGLLYPLVTFGKVFGGGKEISPLNIFFANSQLAHTPSPFANSTLTSNIRVEKSVVIPDKRHENNAMKPFVVLIFQPPRFLKAMSAATMATMA